MVSLTLFAVIVTLFGVIALVATYWAGTDRNHNLAAWFFGCSLLFLGLAAHIATVSVQYDGIYAGMQYDDTTTYWVSVAWSPWIYLVLYGAGAIFFVGSLLYRIFKIIRASNWIEWLRGWQTVETRTHISGSGLPSTVRIRRRNRRDHRRDSQCMGHI